MSRNKITAIFMMATMLFAVTAGAGAADWKETERNIAPPHGSKWYEQEEFKTGMAEIISQSTGNQRLMTADSILSPTYKIYEEVYSVDGEQEIFHYQIYLGDDEHSRFILNWKTKLNDYGCPVITHCGALSMSGAYCNSTSYDIPPDENTPSLEDLLLDEEIDAWSIDFPYSLVSENETDFSFMEYQNTSFYVECSHKGAEVMNYIRDFVGSDGNVTGIGFSQGCLVLLGLTIKYPEDLDRQILIEAPGQLDPVKNVDIIAQMEAELAKIKADQANETFYSSEMVVFKSIVESAKTDPLNDSAIIPGFNNTLALNFSLIYTNQLPGNSIYNQGFCAGDMENGLYHTELGAVYEMTEKAVPHQPNPLDEDIYGLMAGIKKYQIPYEEVPIKTLNVQAEGGIGSNNDYAAEQIPNCVTVKYYRLSHLDMIISKTAIEEFWMPFAVPWIKC